MRMVEENYIAQPKQFYTTTESQESTIQITNIQRGFFETFTNCPQCGQTCVIRNGILYNYNSWKYDYIYVELTDLHTHNDVSLGGTLSTLLFLSILYIAFKKFLYGVCGREV